MCQTSSEPEIMWMCDVMFFIIFWHYLDLTTNRLLKEKKIYIHILGNCWDFKKRFSLNFVLVRFTEGPNLSYSPLAGGFEASSPKQGFVYSLLSFSEYFLYGFIASNKAGLVLHCGELHQSMTHSKNHQPHGPMSSDSVTTVQFSSVSLLNKIQIFFA